MASAGDNTIIDFNRAAAQGSAARSQVNADDIRERLHANARGFVEWLYSGRAYIARNEARIGNVYGEPGASLSIRLSGTDAGLWKDHATDEGGDLIALYRAYMGYSGNTNFQLSLKELAREFLRDPIEVDSPPWKASVADRIEKKKKELGTKPRSDMLELGAPVATFKYYDIRGNVIASVVRYEPDGIRKNKTFLPYCFKTIDGVIKWVAGAPELRPLYRIPDIALAPVVILCEGEGKADALTAMGIVATSAMQGSNAPIEKTDWSTLHGKTVIIWPDNDETGHKYAYNAATHLTAIGIKVAKVDVPAGKPEGWDAADCIAEGEDPRSLIDAAKLVTASTPAPASRIRLFSLDDLENLPPISWLVDGILTQNGLSMIWGRSGSLKSFVALDFAMSIASAREWHGHNVAPGRVIYIAAEGAFGLAQRAFGWAQNRGREARKPDILLLPQAITLTSEDLSELLLAIRGAGEPPVFIVIDTMSRTIGSGNPNQPADMNVYVNAADRLRLETGAHIMVVHHAGEDESKNEIGNKALRNACDTVIFVKRNATRIELINEAPKGKQKDAEEFKTIKLTPKKIAYSMKDGGERTTLLLNLEDDTPLTSEEIGAATEQRLSGGAQQAVFAALMMAGVQGLGLTNLALKTGKDNRSITRALDNLCGKDMVEIASPEGVSPKIWRVK